MSESNPSIAVRGDEDLDWNVLDAHLKEVIDGLTGDPEVSQYPSGNSNLTYRLRYPERDLVVRRPPFGTRPKSGHSMIREYRVMSALKPVYPAVPTTLYHTDDESIIGAEFYVMERVEGPLVHNRIPPEWGFSESDTRTLCESFCDQLIALHQVDYQAIGLADFGRPEGYVERQIAGWNRRYQKVLTEDVDAFEDVQQWLEDHRPEESGSAIVHGDFRFDNMILDAQDPRRIGAILDWEICALGDPLMDLGNTLSYWIHADDPPYLQALKRQPSDAPGMLRREEILALYTQRMGIQVPDFTVYLVYGFFRLAVILQQIYFRYVQGQTADQRFKTFGVAVNALGNHARQLTQTGS